MKRIIAGAVLGSLTVLGSQAAWQGATPVQRLHFKIGIPSGQQPRLVLPDSNTIELSALSMERNDESILRLSGAAEIRFALSPSRAAVIRSDEASYDLNTGEVRIPSDFSMTEEPSPR